MNKRALMLTAAAAALLSGQAYGATPDYTDIKTGVTVPIATATATSGATVGTPGNIIIDTSGAVTISTNPPTAPAVTINSSNTVTNTTNITYTGVNGAVGVLLEEAAPPTTSSGTGAAESWTGEFINGENGTNSTYGVINLTGAGDDKVGILIAGGAYNGVGVNTDAGTGTYENTGLGVFTGVVPSGGGDPVAIDLEAGSTLEVQGTSSYGIELIGPAYSGSTPTGGATLVGDIDIAGTLAMTPTTLGATTATGNVAVDIAGSMTGYAMTGNLNIGSAGASTQGMVSSEGAGAQGVVVLGKMDGAITNYGTLETLGVTTPSTATNATDPEAGSALVVANTITGGIDNELGATISTRGTAPTIFISTVPTTFGVVTEGNVNDQVPITIGPVANSSLYPGQFSLFNSGTISAQAEDANNSSSAISLLGGSSTVNVTLSNGIFNSGAISAIATTNTLTQTEAPTATALSIGSFVTVGTGTDTFYSPNVTAALVNTNELGTGTGTIEAKVSGPDAGTATAISIAPNASLPSIFNSGTISASATTTTLTQTGTTLSAFAINDASGTLTTITNEGTISAVATLLDSNDQASIDTSNQAVAINVSNNLTTPVTINDTAVSGPAEIIGDIYFGTQPGTLNVQGATTADYASVSGSTVSGEISAERIIFNNKTNTPDTLTIGTDGSVTGSIEEANGGTVDISIAQSGVLNLQTTAPTNLNSNVSTAVSAGAPLDVNQLTVGSPNGGALNISLSQGYNVAVYSGSYVINAIDVGSTNANVTIGDPSSGTNGLIHPLTVTFGSYIASPNNAPAEFVLINSATPINISTSELNDLTTLYSTANSPNSTAIPYLFTSSICAYDTTTSTAASTCSAPAPTGTTSSIVLMLTPKTVGTGADQIPLTGYAAQMFKYANEALINDNTLGAAMINDITNAPQAQAAYAAFAPDVSGATRATAISLTDSATNVVAARQRELRMYVGQEGDTTLWGQQFAQRLSQSGSKNGLSGWNDPGFGFTMGLDGGDPVDGRYGGAFTFFGGGMSAKGPTDAKTEEEYYLLTGYTDWRGKGLFLDTQASVGYGSLKGKRYLTLTEPGVTSVDCTTTSLCREADGNRASELLSGGVTTGAIFNAGGTVFTPQLSVDGMTMREEGYTELGGGQGFDLTVRPYYADSLRTFLGADVRQDVNLGDFFFQPDLRVGYRYDFANGAVKLRANFASVNNSVAGEKLDPFTVEGPDPGHGNLVLGGGFATTTGSWSIGLNYDYVRSGSGPTEQDGVLTLVGRI